MILKRTKPVTSIARALSWVGGYANKVANHQGKDLSTLGVGLGKDYRTLRPTGIITAHGYATDQFARARLQPPARPPARPPLGACETPRRRRQGPRPPDKPY